MTSGHEQFSVRDVSRHPESLWFNDIVEGASYFDHQFSDYKLEARIVRNQLAEMPWVLSVHGSRADYTKTNAISLGLRKRGFSIIDANMSGHTKTLDRHISETSLGSNIKEAEAFYGYLNPNRPKVVIGYSIGCTPILKLLDRHSEEISTVVLFYPGIYSPSSYDKPYGELFRQVISRPYSYRETDVIELLARFAGKVVLVRGEYDGLDPLQYGQPGGTSAGLVEIDGTEYYSPIPPEVFAMVRSATSPPQLERDCRT